MGIVEDTFTEWTKGLSAEESRVAIFHKIRDIPYFIDPGHLSLEKGPCGMLEDNRGSCYPKHYLLGMIYTKIGVPVKYCAYGFKWKDQKVDYPDNVRAMAGNLPTTYHLACRALIKAKWVFLDATWDPELAIAGFPVNIDWDGESDTKLAVEPEREERTSLDIHERDRMFLEMASTYSLGEKLGLARFTFALNRWLEDVRKNGE
jgi:hypothetical protein